MVAFFPHSDSTVAATAIAPHTHISKQKRCSCEHEQCECECEWKILDRIVLLSLNYAFKIEVEKNHAKMKNQPSQPVQTFCVRAHTVTYGFSSSSNLSLTLAFQHFNTVNVTPKLDGSAERMKFTMKFSNGWGAEQTVKNGELIPDQKGSK